MIHSIKKFKIYWNSSTNKAPNKHLIIDNEGGLSYYIKSL
jgi:hypothetical protein